MQHRTHVLILVQNATLPLDQSSSISMRVACRREMPAYMQLQMTLPISLPPTSAGTRRFPACSPRTNECW